MPYAGKRHVLSGKFFGWLLTTSTSTRESAFGDLSTRRLLKELDVSDLTLGLQMGCQAVGRRRPFLCTTYPTWPGMGQSRLAHMRQLCLDVLRQSSDYLGHSQPRINVASGSA